MRTKLLLTFCLFAVSAFAQAPAASYYGTGGSHFAVMTGTINQSATGANLIWNFNNMDVIGESYDVESVPTASELIIFPGSTKVVTTTTIGTNTLTKLYSKAPLGNLSVTGADNSGVLLNYNTNNANLGTFPLAFGYAHTDAVSGTYDNGQYAGTFSGNIVTSVDAWGTLNLGTGGQTTISAAATRLKTVQTLSLNYTPFNNVGTITVTTHSYYVANLPAGVPRFRTTQTTVSVPLLSINDTFTSMEAYTFTELARDSFEQSAFVIAPNPVNDVLSIQSPSEIRRITVTDTSGKIVLTASEATRIDVGHLQKGIYFARIQTDSGTTVKKFIRN